MSAESRSNRPGRPTAVSIDGKLLRLYRNATGLSRTEASETLGVTTRTLQRAENHGIIGLSLFRAVCDLFQIPRISLECSDLTSIPDRLRAHGLAPGRAPILFGRDPETAWLVGQLTKEKVRRIIVITGPVSIGKASLVRHFIEATQGHYSGGVVWIGSGLQNTRLVQMEIAKALGFEHALPRIEETGRDWRQSFSANFWRRPRLIVLDDARSAEHVRDFVCDDEHASLIVTTCFRHIAEDIGTDILELGPLSDANVRQLLAERTHHGMDDVPPAEYEALLQVVGGMPGLANIIAATLRRERLTTVATLLERIRTIEASPAGESMASAVEAFFRGLQSQISPQAWNLFVALGAFGTEPMPLSWAGVAAQLDEPMMRSAASELVDAHMVHIHEPDDDGARQPWLRLSSLPAIAARRLLGDRRATTWVRIADHAIAIMWQKRGDSIAALSHFWHRHRMLILALRDAALGKVELHGNLAQIEGKEDIEPLPTDPRYARLLIDSVMALAPLVLDRTITDGADWLELALRVATGLPDDAARQGRIFLLLAMWRGFVLGLPPLKFFGQCLDLFRLGDDVEGEVCLQALLGYEPFIGKQRTDSDAFAGEFHLLVKRLGSTPAAKARLLAAGGGVGFILAGDNDAATKAAQTHREALSILSASKSDCSLIEAVIRLNACTFDHLANGGRPEAFEVCAADLLEREARPWIRAGIMAHAAHFGARLGQKTPAAAMDLARDLLFEAIFDCRAEDAARVLWFVHSCSFYLILRASPPTPVTSLTRGDVGRIALTWSGGEDIIAGLCGMDYFLILSLSAMEAILDLRCVNMALGLADCSLAGSMTTRTLQALRELRMRPKMDVEWPSA